MLEIKAIKFSRMKATRMLGKLGGSLYFVSSKMQMEKLRKLNAAWQGSQRCSETAITLGYADNLKVPQGLK
jgi:hypothetical protein